MYCVMSELSGSDLEMSGANRGDCRRCFWAAGCTQGGGDQIWWSNVVGVCTTAMATLNNVYLGLGMPTHGWRLTGGHGCRQLPPWLLGGGGAETAPPNMTPRQGQAFFVVCYPRPWA